MNITQTGRYNEGEDILKFLAGQISEEALLKKYPHIAFECPVCGREKVYQMALFGQPGKFVCPLGHKKRKRKQKIYRKDSLLRGDTQS